MKPETYARPTALTHDGNSIAGLAAVYWDKSNPGSQFAIDDKFVVRFPVGSLKLRDTVFAYWGHDSGKLLAKTPDSLRLTLDHTGLHFSMTPYKTSYSDDLLALIGAGGVSGCSFGCYPTKTRMSREGDIDVRWIEQAEVFEISPTHCPAFNATEVALLDRENFWRSELAKYEEKLQRIMNI